MASILRTIKDSVKKVVVERQAKAREAEIKANSEAIGREGIADGLRQLGIEPGDTVMLHSSLKSLGFVEGGPRAVLEAILDAVGSTGTLVVPTYYLPGGTIAAAVEMQDYVFDPRTHDSVLGALPNAFLKMPGIQRSLHPTHSVSALGPQAGFVTADHHKAPSIFGEGSPWERCVRLNAKVLGLGITMGPVTFYHVVEDAMGDAFPVPVRLPRQYMLKCREAGGSIVEVPVRAFDPEIVKRRIDMKDRPDLRDFMMADFQRAGILTDGMVGQASSWFVRSQDFYNRIAELAGQGITIYSDGEAISEFVRRQGGLA